MSLLTSAVITPAEAAEIARVSERTVLRWIVGELPGTPKLPAVQIGKRWRIRRESLERFLGISAESQR